MSMSTPLKYHSLQILTSCVHFASASVIAFCLSRRIPPFTWRSWRNLTWSRLCVILVLLDSWYFVVFSGILLTGIGTNWNQSACTIAICICISIYVLSKLLIYSFLSERVRILTSFLVFFNIINQVYIVWSGGNQRRRLQTPVYQLCCFILVGFGVVAVFMIVGRETYIRTDGVCVIGLRQSVGIGLVVYDLFFNVFLTVMFLWPLWGSPRSRAKMSPKLRKLAKRTLYGATTSLICSATNITILTALGGNELGWVCMNSCVSDVVINALVLYWISSPIAYSRQHEIPHDRFSLPTMNLTALTATTISQSPQDLDSESKAPDATRVESQKTQGQDLTLQGKIPDEMFDYIPKEHLQWRDVDDDDYIGEEGRKKASSNSNSDEIEHTGCQKDFQASPCSR